MTASGDAIRTSSRPSSARSSAAGSWVSVFDQVGDVLGASAPDLPLQRARVLEAHPLREHGDVDRVRRDAAGLRRPGPDEHRVGGRAGTDSKLRTMLLGVERVK